MDRLSVEVLKSLSNPLTGTCWDGLDRPITRREIKTALGDPLSPDEGPAATREEHARRVAWFVIHGHANAICVDVGCPSFPGYRESWVIQDGNHRFAAAVYRGDEIIEANFGGEIDYAEEIGLLLSPTV